VPTAEKRRPAPAGDTKYRYPVLAFRRAWDRAPLQRRDGYGRATTRPPVYTVDAERARLRTTKIATRESGRLRALASHVETAAPRVVFNRRCRLARTVDVELPRCARDWSVRSRPARSRLPSRTAHLRSDLRPRRSATPFSRSAGRPRAASSGRSEPPVLRSIYRIVLARTGPSRASLTSAQARAGR
jgi:hypothetical protein